MTLRYYEPIQEKLKRIVMNNPVFRLLGRLFNPKRGGRFAKKYKRYDIKIHTKGPSKLG